MIQTDSGDIEQIRERLHKMSDMHLRKFGRSAAVMSDPKRNFGAPHPAFKIQLRRGESGMAQEASEIGMSASPERPSSSRRNCTAADARSSQDVIALE
jgi:hypothetical protein